MEGEKQAFATLPRQQIRVAQAPTLGFLRVSGPQAVLVLQLHGPKRQVGLI